MIRDIKSLFKIYSKIVLCRNLDGFLLFLVFAKRIGKIFVYKNFFIHLQAITKKSRIPTWIYII